MMARNRDNAGYLRGLQSILPAFSIFPEIERVILFGSRARGDQDDRSDIDLAIDAPTMDIVGWSAFCDYMDENSETLLKLDLVWLQKAQERLKENILKDGITLYER